MKEQEPTQEPWEVYRERVMPYLIELRGEEEATKWMERMEEYKGDNTVKETTLRGIIDGLVERVEDKHE